MFLEVVEVRSLLDEEQTELRGRSSSYIHISCKRSPAFTDYFTSSSIYRMEYRIPLAPKPFLGMPRVRGFSP